MKAKELKLLLVLLLVSLCFIHSSCNEHEDNSSNNSGNGGGVEHDAIIMHSTDGGVDWSSKLVEYGTEELYGIAKTSQGNFVAVGRDADNNGQVMCSTNSGNNWYSAIVSGSFGCKFTGIHSNSLNKAVIVSPVVRQNIWHTVYRTTDNGNNWDTVINTLGLNAVSFHGTDYGAIVGNHGQIIRTTDAGSTWLDVNSPISNDLFGVAFYNDDGLAVGSLGKIIKTTNGGLTWSTMGTPVQSTLKSVAYYYTSYGAIAVGSGGTILRSVDGGLSWEPPGTEYTAYFYGVASMGTGKILAVGTGGTIVKSTDYGANWTQMNSGTTRNLYGLYCSGDDCWVVGD